MAPMDKKRKAALSEEEEEDVLEGELTDGLLDGVLSQSEDEDEGGSGSESEDQDEDESAHSAGDQDDFRVVKDANGNERYEYREVDAVYDSDDSDAQEPVNTIGDIPLSFYDSYPHIGYDINGKKIMRPAAGEALDALLDSVEVPRGWTGLTDKETGKPLQISQQELELIRKVQSGILPDEGVDPYPDTVEWFTSFEEKMPLSAAPEPKRRFLPSKHEQVRIMKLVRLMREGKILPYKPPKDEDEDEEDEVYDIWSKDGPQEYSNMHIPAPKPLPPGFDLSYNPPPEYLPTEEERKAWEEADAEDREKDYLPSRYDSLRKVPAYASFVKDRFERCLDLYLAPRIRKNRLNIDPNSLLPKLPRPEELKPFPTVCHTVFTGHQGRVRSLEIDPSGEFLASGGDDGTLRVWELGTGKCLWTVKLGDDEPVDAVRWRPTKDTFIVAAAVADDVFLAIPSLTHPEAEQSSRHVLDAGFGYNTQPSTTTTQKEPPAKWARPGAKLETQGVALRITMKSSVEAISWHRRGDYFCTVSPRGQRSSVAIHILSRHLTQIPFRKLAGLAQAAHFHPSRPLFFVATQRTIRCYDLRKQELYKTLQPGAKWISSFDIHPSGDNVIVGSFDKRLLWHELDLNTRPYKTMRFHEKAVRAVAYHHGGLPLFADASDDGSLQIFHAKVANDSMETPTIVPLKMLKGHGVVKSLGVLDVNWHPRHPWIVSAGADGTCRLWA